MARPSAVDQLRAMAQLLPAEPAGDRLTGAVAEAIAAGIDAVGGPMRLAVTGQIKRGKSTLINALTRSEIAETGVDEITAEFHEYQFTDAMPGNLWLIDTPGLGSPVNDTGGNAGLRADCTVHLFHRNVHRADVDYLRDLLARDGTQPLPTRVLGVISACDLSWPPGPDHAGATDPLAFQPLRDFAGGIIRQVERNPVNRELFYAVLPVAALVAEGGWSLTGDQIEVLADLAKTCDAAVLAGHLQSQAGFVQAELVAEPAHRRALLTRLGQWGIHLACSYLRDPSATEAGLGAYLDEQSGVTRLRAAIVEHFIGRGAFIKLEHHLRLIEKVLADARVRLQLDGSVMPAHLAEVGRRIEHLRANSLGLHELALVEVVNRHRHRLTVDEAAQLAELTGASGLTVMARLGLPADVGVREMLVRAIERRRRWSQREMALPTLAPAVVRTYERLIGRLTETRSLLDSLD